jgi:hypothetical protein
MVVENEANLREQKEAWIVFGVSSKAELKGAETCMTWPM